MTMTRSITGHRPAHGGRSQRGGDRTSLVTPSALRCASATPPRRMELAELDTTESLSRLEGRAAPYGAWTPRGWYLESFAAGLFDKSITEFARGLPLMLWHDGAQFPIGVTESWESRADGLYGVWRLDTSPVAQEAARLARDGFMSSMSVGYYPLLSEWELADADAWDPNDATTLDRVVRIDARLAETSLLSTPAFEAAEVLHVAGKRVLPGPRHAERTPALETWRAWRHTL